MKIAGFIKKLKLNGLRSQLILGIASILAVLMSLLVIELMNRQKNFFLKLNHDRAFGLSSTLASTAESYVMAYELAGLQKLVSTYKNNPGLQYAIVLSDDGIVLAHTDEKYLGQQAIDSISEKLKPVKTTQILIETNSILDIAAPIINHDKIIGWARIGLSQEYIEPNLTAIRRNGLLFILISLIVGSVFAILIAGRLSSGLQKLITAAEKIKGGNRNLRVGNTNSFETSQLGTAFNQMLDEISSNEKLLSMVLENMPVGVWIINEQGNIVSINPAGKELWKGTEYVGIEQFNKYLGRSVETGKLLEAHEWGAAIALREGRPVLDQEIEIECFDKSHKIILNSAIPLRDANEKIIGAIAINVDITERKKAEEQILERESQLSAFFENIEGAAALLDAEKKYLLFNSRFIEDHRLLTNQDPYVGQEVYDLFPEEMRIARIKILDNVLKGNKEVVEADYLRNGRRIYYRSAFTPVITNQNITGISTYSLDLTKSKETEISIRESEERNRAMIENIGDGIVVFNESKKVIYQSPSVQRINGYTMQERNNLNLEEIIYKDDLPAYFDFLNKVYDNPGIPIQVQFRMLHKSGHIIWTEGSVVNMLNNKSINGIIVNYRDITERKKATELFKWQFENSPDIILIINRDLKIESINRGRPDGSSAKDLIGADAIEVLPDESRDIARKMILQCFETGEKQEIENTINGNRWVRSRFVPLKIDGKISSIMIIATDINERKLAEQKLKSSEEKNRALVENITDAIILLNEKMEPIYRSPSVQKILGFSENDLEGKNIFDNVHPDDRKDSFNFFQKTLNNPGNPMQGQFRILHKNGNYIWGEGTIMNMLHNKSINAIILNYRDITERKRFEEQQLLITSIVNSTDDAIISKTLDGIITSWNRGAENILGYPAEEAVGKHISIIVPVQLIGEEDFIIKSVSGGHSVDHFETRRRRKDGKLIDVSITVSPITDSLGKIIGASKILRDITERKKAEESIRQSEANYRQLFDNSPAPMWVIDEVTSAIIRVNQACIRNYGYSEEELLGMAITEISPNEPILVSKAEDITDMFFMGSQQHRKKSGELIDVITSSIPIKLDDVKSLLLIAIDVTEKNQYEQKLAKAAIKVQEEERYEIGGELHDNVCQLLAGALMCLAVIKRSLPEQAMDMYQRTHQTISFATDEIRNLSHRLAPAFFDKETLEEALKRLLGTFNVENKYAISLNVSKKINERLLNLDLQLNLYRILQEQLKNIMKHAQASEIAVEITLNDHTLQMRITDNGIGFDPKISKGGIGLANMNRRVRLFSGSFTINSSIGNGCEVLVDIPIDDSF